MVDEQQGEVLEELRRLSRVIVTIELQDMREKNQKDQIETLEALGFRPMEIASILGITTNALNVARFRARKKAAKAPKA